MSAEDLVDLVEELQECTTSRKRWWAIKLDGYFYGEVINPEDGIAGFDFALFDSEEGAHERVREVFEADDLERLPYEIVEIQWKECK